MKIALLAVTAALVIAAVLLTASSFRRTISDDSMHGLTGMLLMIAAAVPAAIYATLG